MAAHLTVSFNALQSLARLVGLDLMGVSKATPKPIEAQRLALWQEQGLAAEMNYMLRDASLQSDPLRLLPEARSVISLVISYDNRRASPAQMGFGRVARYAWGKDYHLVLPNRLFKLIELCKQNLGEFKYRIFSDAVPLLERSFASSAGLGFIGKNTLLIRPKVGSFTLLAEIICDFEVVDLPLPIQNGNCGTCQNCLDACPTKAFKSEYVLDAGKCISYLSIEKRGALNLAERSMLGDWIFGCDICQEVCPFNYSTLKAEKAPDFEEFSADSGVGPHINLMELFTISSDTEFLNKFKDTPLLRSKRHGLIRNGICVAVNTQFVESLKEMEKLAINDPHPLVRQFAYWGLHQLGVIEGRSSATITKWLEKGVNDPDLNVREEVALLKN